MNTSQLPASDSIAAAFERDGFYIVPELLTPEECDELKVEALRVLREYAKPNATVYLGAAAASPLYHRLASDARIVSVLQQVMPDGVMFLSDKIVFKSADQKFATPWHIDAFYWRNTRPKLSVWIPLDDAMTENGTLKVLPGSHKRDWQPRRGDTSSTNNEFNNVIANEQWRPEEVVTCNLKRGGAVFFSDLLPHASCPNTAGTDRFTIISTYHAPAEDEPFDKDFPDRRVIMPKS